MRKIFTALFFVICGLMANAQRPTFPPTGGSGSTSSSSVGISVFGDSISAGTGSTPSTPFPVNSFPWQLHLKTGGPFYYEGQIRPGDQCLDTATREMQRILPQGNGTDPATVFESVTNDISGYNSNTNLQNVFSRCALNAMAWASIPAANKILGGSMSLAGGFAQDAGTSSLQPGMGAVCTTLGCTAQTSITTKQANAPICVGYMIKNGNGGTATFSIDGTPQTDPFNLTTTFNFFGDGSANFTTGNSLSQGPVAACFPVVTAGSHTVLVTGTSGTSASNIVEIYYVGTAPPVSGTNPYFVYVSANPRTDGSASLVTTYNTLIQNQITGLIANGGSTLNVLYADTYSAEVNIATQTTVAITPTTTTYTANTGWTVDVGVAYQNNLGNPGTPLAKISSNPSVGQYSVSSGVYTFNSADLNRPLLVTYTLNCGGGSAPTAVTNCGADTIHPANPWAGGMATVIAAKLPTTNVIGVTAPNNYQTGQIYGQNGFLTPAYFPAYSDPIGMSGMTYPNGIKRFDGISGPHFDFWNSTTGWTHAVPNTGGTPAECWWHYSNLGSGGPIAPPGSTASCDFWWQSNGVFTFNIGVQVQSLTITKTGLTGTIALPTGAITSGTCSTAGTLAVGGSGISSTTAFAWSFSSDPSAITGYPSLNVFLYGTSNTINVKVCNPTAGSITPAAATINVRAIF